MPRSLGDIPGSNRPRKRFARSKDRDLWGPSRSFNLDLTPRGVRLNKVRTRRFLPGDGMDLSVVLIGLAALAVVLWMSISFWQATRVRAEISGLESGASFMPEEGALLAVALRVPGSDDRFRADLTVDGVDVLDDLGFLGDTLHVLPSELVKQKLVEGALDEGEHTIRLSVGRLFLPDSVFRWTYRIDSIAPLLKLPATLDAVPIDQPVIVAGTIEEGARLQLDGKDVDHRGGTFEVEFERPPTGVLHFVAHDPAGNRTALETVVPITYPASSRGVHVSMAAWASNDDRAAILGLVDRGLIDTVELDLKDERGVVGYASKLKAPTRIGAVRAQIDLKDALTTLRKRNVRVIGRIVAFRDPIYTAAAWADGRKDEVLQSASGEPLTSYGGFSNYVHPAVQKYNLDIALEAADLGVRDILWDYVRRPEGNPESMIVPGLDGASSAVIVEFLGKAHTALRAKGTYQGASVLGIAAASGNSIAQDVPAMARSVDYLAPSIYPVDWGPGQYRVDRPAREPFEITKRSLAHFQQVTADSGVRFLPWLQDFSVGPLVYGPGEVRAQIDAAASLGLDGFLLWNPRSRYTAEALQPIG